MKWIGVLVLALFGSSAWCQNALWTQTIGFNGAGNDGGWELSLDHDNNVIVAGFLKNDAYANSIFLPANGTHDLFVAKYDDAGNIQWAKRHGSNLSDQYRDVAIDEANNLYCVGYISGDSQIDTFNVQLKGTSRDAVLVKYSKDGDVMWVKQFWGTEAGYTNRGDIDVKYANGMVYCAGSYIDSLVVDSSITLQNTNNKEDIFLIAVDTAGSIVNAKKYGNIKDEVFSCMTVNPVDSSIYLSGVSSGNVNFDGIIHTNSSTSYDDSFIVKIGSDWNAKWVRSFGGTQNQNINNIELYGSDRIYVIGKFEDTLVIDDASIAYSSPDAALELFIMQLDSAGEVVKDLLYGGPGGQNSGDISAHDGSLFITGSYNTGFIYGADTIASVSPKDLYIMKIDTSLAFEWFKRYDGYPASGKSPSITGIDVDSCGYIYFTGGVMDAVYYDSILTVSSGSSIDVITGKLNPKPEANFIAGNTVICPGDSVLFTDNSACSTIGVEWFCSGANISNDTLENTYMSFDSTGQYPIQFVIHDGWTSDTLWDTLQVVIGGKLPELSDTTICFNRTVELQVDSTFLNYTWSNGDTSYSSSVTAGLYWVEVEDSIGCLASDTSLVSEFLYNQLDLGADTSLCVETNPSGFDIYAGDYQDYLWSTSSLDSAITVNSTGSYTVSVIDSNGCEQSDSIHVEMLICTDIHSTNESELSLYPNPSSSFINIQSNDANISTIEILDSYGKVIYIESFNRSLLVDLGGFAKGMYWARGLDKNNAVTFVRKVIVQ